MIIALENPAPVRRHSSFKSDALTLKLTVAILFGALFVTTSAFIRNDTRNITEDIRRAENRHEALLADFVAERGLWKRCNNIPNLADMLADRGIAMAPPAAEKIVYVSPARGQDRDAVGISAPSSVASR